MAAAPHFALQVSIFDEQFLDRIKGLHTDSGFPVDVHSWINRRKAAGSQQTRYFTGAAPIAGELRPREFPPSAARGDRAPVRQTRGYHGGRISAPQAERNRSPGHPNRTTSPAQG